MNLPLISHEIPHSRAEAEADGKYIINDYHFILLHRYIEDDSYRSIVDSCKKFTILDNSCFELGAALSNSLIAEYVDRIKPDVFVLPDVLGDYKQTINRTREFLEEYPDLDSNAMAVIQGNSHKEFIDCYKEFDDTGGIGMIGIPFCFNWAWDLEPEEHAMERVKLIRALEPYINKNRKHHLLGTWHISEFANYKDYDWVYSVDTSNPIAAGIEGDRYPIFHKPKIKFDEFVDYKLTDFDIDDIMYNVKVFKETVKR